MIAGNTTGRFRFAPLLAATIITILLLWMVGHAADISVGSVGSVDGYSSVLIRSEEGLEAFSHVREKLSTRSLDKPQALDKLDALDKRVAFSSIKRAFDPVGILNPGRMYPGI